jgi:tetratricopeptide (TPR) repeat protein
MLKWPVIFATALFLAVLEAAQSGPATLAAAEAQLRRGDYATASETLDRLIAAEPASAPGVYRMLGESWLALKQPERAADALERGLKAHPQDPLLAKSFGQLLFRYQPTSARAGGLLALAAKALPRDPEAHHYYAQWAFLNSQAETALNEEKKVLAMPALNETALLQVHTLIAMANANLNRDADAEAAFRKALVLNRARKAFDPASAFQFVSFLKQQGRDEEAAEIVNELLRKTPSYGPAHLERAKQLNQDEKLTEAAAEAELSLKLEGSDPAQVRSAHVLLAMVYFNLGKTQEANTHKKWIETH